MRFSQRFEPLVVFERSLPQSPRKARPEYPTGRASLLERLRHDDMGFTARQGESGASCMKTETKTRESPDSTKSV